MLRFEQPGQLASKQQPLSFTVTAYNRRNRETVTSTYFDPNKASEAAKELRKLGLITFVDPDYE